MKDLDVSNGQPLTDVVKIDLNMLCALVLNWVGGEVDSVDIVAVDPVVGRQRAVELLQELAQPACLSYDVGDDHVLGFCT